VRSCRTNRQRRPSALNRDFCGGPSHAPALGWPRWHKRSKAPCQPPAGTAPVLSGKSAPSGAAKSVALLVRWSLPGRVEVDRYARR
jgi:hypothetical protein